MDVAVLKYIEDAILYQVPQPSDSYSLSASMLWCHPTIVQGLIFGVSTGVMHLEISCSLHFDQL